jgi:NAD(P)-dependent dehydrogenase (short-subunit alcohol dehydrogenase family)
MNIIITGASQGIGWATVKKLSRDGSHRIVAIARNGDKLNELWQECLAENPEAQVFPVAFDLLSTGYSFNLLPAVFKVFNTVDVLINNAGLLVKKEFLHLTDEDFDRAFNVNVKSVFKLTRALLGYFNNPAHIVNISSMGGVQGSSKFPGLTLYSASKGAVAVLTEAMAEEFKPRGIRVNCLAFGAVQTEMLAEAFPGYKAPLTAEEMASFVADFALNGLKFFNGKILPVSLSTP